MKDRFREIRKMVGCSQLEFAHVLDSSQAVISGIETGAKDLSRRLLVNLAKNCPSISINWLLVGHGPMILPNINEDTEMKDQESKKFVAKVYYLMQINGITQSDMARKLGVKRAFIYQVIHGMRPGFAIRDKIAKEVGFSSWEDLKKHEEVLK